MQQQNDPNQNQQNHNPYEKYYENPNNQQNPNQQNNNQQNNQQNAEKEKTKLPFWRQFSFAFRGPKYYILLMQQTKGSFVKYFFGLILLITLLTIFVPMSGYIIGVGGVGNYITERIPEFSMEGGVLQMSSTMEYESNSMKLYADTSKEEYTKEDVDKEAYIQILISKSNAIVYSGGLVTNYPFAEFKNVMFDKGDLITFVPLIYVFILFYCVVSIFSQTFYVVTTMLLFAVIGMITNRLYQFHLRFGELFTIALYAVTVTTMLEAFNTALSLFSSSAVSMVGMVWAAFYFFTTITIYGNLKKTGQL